jgi:hypothetical protein
VDVSHVGCAGGEDVGLWSVSGLGSGIGVWVVKVGLFW